MHDMRWSIVQAGWGKGSLVPDTGTSIFESGIQTVPVLQLMWSEHVVQASALTAPRSRRMPPSPINWINNSEKQGKELHFSEPILGTGTERSPDPALPSASLGSWHGIEVEVYPPWSCPGHSVAQAIIAIWLWLIFQGDLTVVSAKCILFPGHIMCPLWLAQIYSPSMRVLGKFSSVIAQTWGVSACWNIFLPIRTVTLLLRAWSPENPIKTSIIPRCLWIAVVHLLALYILLCLHGTSSCSEPNPSNFSRYQEPCSYPFLCMPLLPAEWILRSDLPLSPASEEA